MDYYIPITARKIYEAEQQAKYYYNKMLSEPKDEEWLMRYNEAKSDVREIRDESGYFNELEDAVALLWAEELQRDNHPDYSYEEQMEILKQAIKKRLKFFFLKKNYYSDENAWKIVTALATTNFLLINNFKISFQKLNQNKGKVLF